MFPTNSTSGWINMILFPRARNVLINSFRLGKTTENLF